MQVRRELAEWRSREEFFKKRRTAHRRSMTRHTRMSNSTFRATYRSLDPFHDTPPSPIVVPEGSLETQRTEKSWFSAAPLPKVKQEKRIRIEGEVVERTLLYWKAFTGDIVPENREGATLCCAAGSMYLFGGLGSILLNDLFVLDIQAREWRQICPAKRLLWPDQRYGHSATVIERNFFIFGGQQRFNELKKLRTCFNDLWCFDTVKERFVAQYVNGFTMARAFHVAVPVHRNIFIHGGLDKHSQLLNNACYFSLDLKSWIDLPISNPQDGPGGLAHHSAVGLFDKSSQNLKLPKNGVIYIFGGKTQEGLSDKLYALQFDQKLPRWRLMYLVGVGPSPRMGHSLSFLPHLNKLLILGGRYKLQENDDLWGLSLKTLEWQQLGSSGDIPLPRSGHSAALHDDQLLVMGGLSRAIFPRNDLYVLYSARYFSKEGGDQRQEYKKAYYHATGELYNPISMAGTLARFKPKRLLRIQKALESLEEKKLLKAIAAASSQ